MGLNSEQTAKLKVCLYSSYFTPKNVKRILMNVFQFKKKIHFKSSVKAKLIEIGQYIGKKYENIFG